MDAVRQSGGELDQLRKAYDTAFHQFVSAVRDGQGVEEAMREYHTQRDALAAHIMGLDQDRRRHAVEELAYRLWVESGRPAGTADSDWQRAERLARRSRGSTGSMVA